MNFKMFGVFKSPGPGHKPPHLNLKKNAPKNIFHLKRWFLHVKCKMNENYPMTCIVFAPLKCSLLGKNSFKNIDTLVNKKRVCKVFVYKFA